MTHHRTALAPTTTLLSWGLAALAAGVPLSTTATEQLPAGTWRAQRAEIVDRRGFDKPMVAMTMLVPAGWRQQGEVAWTVGAFCTRPYQPVLKAESPDGRGAIELATGEGWGANSFGPASKECPHAAHGSAEVYLKAWVQRHRPGAQWLDYRARPERSRPAQQQALAGGGGIKTWIETGQALIGYTQGGQAMRESLAVSISFMAMQVPMVNRAPMQSIQGESFGVLAWRAPEGQLDFRQFDAMWQTLKSEPEWQARINTATSQMARENAATQAEIGRINAATAAETRAHMQQRAQIRAQTQAEVSAIHSGIARDRAASQDRMHTDRVRVIREVELYRGSGGGAAVELPSHYRHAWRLRDGSYVMTDSPNFDPGRDIGVQGEQLQRTR